MSPYQMFIAGVIEAIHGGLILLDREGRILIWNAWLAERSGIKAVQAQGRTLFEVFPNLSETRLPAAVVDSIELGMSSIFSQALNPKLLCLRRRDGRALEHNVVVRPVEHGGERFALLQLIDITASSDRERVLRDRLDARFDAVVDGAFDAIVTTDHNGHIQWINEAAAAQFGYATSEVLGQSIDLLLLDELDFTGLNRPVEATGLRRNGDTVPLEVSAAPWLSGGRRNLTLILRDLSEAKRAEGALRAAAAVASGTSGAEVLCELVRELAEGLEMEDAYIAVLEGGNESNFTVVASWSRGKHGNAVIDATEGWACRVALEQGRCVIAGGLQSASSVEAKGGVRGSHSYVGIRFGDVDGRVVGVVFVQDPKPLANSALAERLVTAFAARIAGELARQRAESELRALNADLERRVAERTEALVRAAADLREEMAQREVVQSALAQSQKLEALGQLVGGVAHDFNNVLAAVVGSFNLIGRRVSDPSVQDIIVHGRAAADRAAGLVRHLLAFARREELRPTVVDPKELISDISELLIHAAGPLVEVEFSVAPDVWPVLVDRHRLEVALLNLVMNARDAMPAGGHIHIGVRGSGVDEASLPQPGKHGCCVISVQDNGQGMSAETAARAVEPFFTTKGVGKGTGLGLAMVHGFVEQSGGRLQISSEIGRGTLLSLLLPHADANSYSITHAPLVIAPLAEPNTVLLLVDDDEQVRPVTSAFLRDLGYIVLEAAGGQEAIAVALTASRIDLLLSDVVMPVMDGPTLAAHLRARQPDLPVMFMTGHADPSLLAGEEVIMKPFDSEKLGEMISRVLDSRAAPQQLV